MTKRVVIVLGTLFVSLFSLVQPAHASNFIHSVKIDKTDIQVGDVVIWKISASCSTGPINQIYMDLVDEFSNRYWINIPSINPKNPSSNVYEGEFLSKFKITPEAFPGKYSVQSVNLNCQNSDRGISWEGMLDSLSFKVADTGLTPARTQPQITKLEMTTPADRKVGDTVSIRVMATSTGKINTAWVFLRSADGVELFKLWSNYGANITGPQTRNLDTTFDFQVGQDWPPGTWTISKLEVSGYAGIDLVTPWGYDPNPTGSTALANRSVTLLNQVGQNSYGTPSDGAITQPDISAIKINIANATYVPIAPPEISNLRLSATEIRAGDFFNLTVDADGKGANIYNIWANWVNNKSFGGSGIYCYAPSFGESKFQTKLTDYALKCKVPRSTEIGSYAISQLSIYSTSCTGTIRDISTNETQDCQQQPKRRSTDYSRYSVSTTPTFKSKLNNPLSGFNAITVTQAGPLTAPLLESKSVTDSQIKLKYSPDGDLTCNFSSSSGKLDYLGLKGDGTVTVTGIKPATDVKISGSCRASDGQAVNFSESLKTAFPPLPKLPVLLNSRSEIDSVTIEFDNLTEPGYEFEVSSSEGSVLVAGEKVQISDLEVNQSTDISIKVTDPYGQISTGVVGTVKAASPPPLVSPRVTLDKSEKGTYRFSFKRFEDVKYSLTTVNCTAKMVGSTIIVSNLIKKKPATVVLNLKDSYGQSLSIKFFQYTSK